MSFLSRTCQTFDREQLCTAKGREASHLAVEREGKREGEGREGRGGGEVQCIQVPCGSGWSLTITVERGDRPHSTLGASSLSTVLQRKKFG